MLFIILVMIKTFLCFSQVLINVILCIIVSMTNDLVSALKSSKSLVETAHLLNKDAIDRSPSAARARFLKWHKEKVTKVARSSSRSSALIMGAGNCTDFDLEFLADYFGRVVIVDLDSQSVSQRVSQLGSSSRSKVHIVQRDLNGSVEKIVSDAEKSVARARNPAEVLQIVSNMLNFGEISTDPKSEPFDFVYSANVASSFAYVALSYLYAKIQDRFPDLPPISAFYEASNGFVTAMPLLHLANLGNYFDSGTNGFVSCGVLKTPFACPPTDLQSAKPFFFTIDPETHLRKKTALYYLGYLMSHPNLPNSLLNLWQLSARRSSLSLGNFNAQFILDSEYASTSDGRFFEGGINETLLLKKHERPRIFAPTDPDIVFAP
jgi:hypothetical protein